MALFTTGALIGGGVAAGYGGVNLLLKYLREKGQRGLARDTLDAQIKQTKAQAAVTEKVARGKRKATEENIRELKAFQREQRGMAMVQQEIQSRKEQGMMDMAMVNQLIQAMMAGGKTQYDRGSEPMYGPQTSSMMGMIRR